MSQRTPTQEKIGENQYTMYPLAPSRSMDLLTDVVAVISPVVAPIVSSIFSNKGDDAQKNIMDKEINPDMFASAFSALNARELKDVRKALVSAFAEVTEVNGIKLLGTEEAFYMGNIGEMMQWLVWGCKVQWGKSLSGLLASRSFQGASLIPTAQKSPST